MDHSKANTSRDYDDAILNSLKSNWSAYNKYIQGDNKLIAVLGKEVVEELKEIDKKLTHMQISIYINFVTFVFFLILWGLKK